VGSGDYSQPGSHQPRKLVPKGIKKAAKAGPTKGFFGNIWGWPMIDL